MANSIHIRSATESDLPQLQEFEQGVIAAERPLSMNLKADPISYYDLESMLSGDNYEILVAVIDGKTVGCGYARLDKSRDFFKHPLNVYLGFMYVLPEYRGQGISGRLMEALIAWGKGKGAGEARLDVYHQNESAVRAYEKAGFHGLMLHMRKSI